MKSSKFYDDPTNRVVCVFDDWSSAVDAKKAMLESGHAKDHIRIYGEEAASDVDISAKWFADTDEQMKKFEQALRAGGTVLSVLVEDAEASAAIHQTLQSHGARQVTHFGDWITEVIR